MISDSYVVVTDGTPKIRVTRAPGINKSVYKTPGAAKAAARRCMDLSSDPMHDKLTVMTLSRYNAQVPEVEVKNLMSGKMVKIKADEVGGPCDPSTERYWSM